MKLNYSFFVLFCLSFLAACSGGSGSSTPSTPPPPVNVAPSVDAGVDQTVDEGVTVNLSGTANDSDGTIDSYSWSGTGVSITDADMANASFVAPSTGSLSETTLTLTLTVTDNDGATATDTLFVRVNSTNQDPIANAGTDQTVVEQSVVTLDASGSTDDGTITSYTWSQLTGTAVTINGSGASVTFTAPNISVQEDLEFDVTIEDDRGATSRDSVVVTVNPDPVLNNPPIVDAGPDLTTSSGQNVNLSVVNFEDTDGTVEEFLWVQTSGTPVQITGADASDAMFQAPTVTTDTILTFEITVTDNEGATASDSVNVTVTPTPTTVKVSGLITYDNVPHGGTNPNALDYNAITQDPVRGATVQLLENGAVSQTTITDSSGNYSFDVDLNKTYRVRVRAELKQAATQSWDVRIVDNTRSKAIYTLDSSDIVVTTQDMTRNLNARSGWGGSSYTTTRAAGPFHILDRVFDVIEKLKVVDVNLNLAPLVMNWSVNNVAQSGDRTQGQIGTSFYSNDEIYLLGAANSDTDEYDGHVIIHEWGHYFEDNSSRSDSIGGSHTSSDRLDMRVAFGEGFGNAWSGIITDDSFYRDSNGASQQSGFSIDVERNAQTNSGWYNEGSVQSILYDIYDATADGNDSIALGLKPIYDLLIGQQKDTPALTSIFTFATHFKQENASASAGIDALLSGQGINPNVDIWGSNETNNAGQTQNVLPVYTSISLGQTQQVCTLTNFGRANKLSNRRFLRFINPIAGTRTFTISPVSASDADMYLHNQGTIIAGNDAVTSGAFNVTGNIPAGDSVIEVLAYNTAGTDLVPMCINVTAQ